MRASEEHSGRQNLLARLLLHTTNSLYLSLITPTRQPLLAVVMATPAVEGRGGVGGAVIRQEGEIREFISH